MNKLKFEFTPETAQTIINILTTSSGTGINWNVVNPIVQDFIKQAQEQAKAEPEIKEAGEVKS